MGSLLANKGTMKPDINKEIVKSDTHTLMFEVNIVPSNRPQAAQKQVLRLVDRSCPQSSELGSERNLKNNDFLWIPLLLL